MSAPLFCSLALFPLGLPFNLDGVCPACSASKEEEEEVWDLGFGVWGLGALPLRRSRAFSTSLPLVPGRSPSSSSLLLSSLELSDTTIYLPKIRGLRGRSPLLMCSVSCLSYVSCLSSDSRPSNTPHLQCGGSRLVWIPHTLTIFCSAAVFRFLPDCRFMNRPPPHSQCHAPSDS